jgi:hypothetical protein
MWPSVIIFAVAESARVMLGSHPEGSQRGVQCTGM